MLHACISQHCVAVSASASHSLPGHTAGAVANTLFVIHFCMNNLSTPTRSLLGQCASALVMATWSNSMSTLVCGVQRSELPRTHIIQNLTATQDPHAPGKHYDLHLRSTTQFKTLLAFLRYLCLLMYGIDLMLYEFCEARRFVCCIDMMRLGVQALPTLHLQVMLM